MLILSENPCECARWTPLSLMPKIIKDIETGYEVAVQDVSKSHKLTPNLLKSSTATLIACDLVKNSGTFKWYREYYLELVTLLRLSNQPTEVLPMSEELVTTTLGTPNLHAVYLDNTYENILQRDKYNLISGNIEISREILADLEPTFDEFVLGAPNWLEVYKDILMEEYDVASRRHILLKHDEETGRIKYLTSIISDNFKEIADVPSEVDNIVKFLISQKPNLHLVD